MRGTRRSARTRRSSMWVMTGMGAAPPRNGMAAIVGTPPARRPEEISGVTGNQRQPFGGDALAAGGQPLGEGIGRAAVRVGQQVVFPLGPDRKRERRDQSAFAQPGP